MKFKIVSDSSADLTNDYIKDDKIGFEVVPLVINANNQEFIDDDNIDVAALIDAVHKSKEKPKSACPSVGRYNAAYEGADYVICITISSKLSGSYNAAYLGGEDFKGKVHVVDSKLTGGGMRLLVDKAYELMKKDLPFEEICEEIDAYRDSLNLFFVLDSFDNLVKNGRMSKITAFIATALYIKPLCVAENGEIQVQEKPRTIRGALNKLVDNIEKKCSDFENRVCIITHCMASDNANYLKDKIKERYNFKDVIVAPMRGLCSFYALDGGIIVSF